MLFSITTLLTLLAVQCHAYPTLEHLERLAGEQLDVKVQKELRSRVVKGDHSVEARAAFDADANRVNGTSLRLASSSVLIRVRSIRSSCLRSSRAWRCPWTLSRSERVG